MFRVAIVGRPNVGKSTLFNRLCGRRKAIVGDEPGITRDRIFGTLQWQGRTLEVIDTGGIIPEATETLTVKILRQVEAAIEESDLLLLVVDGRAGVTALDEQLVPMLRRSDVPAWVVVNKIDTPAHEAEAASFYQLGFEDLFPVSAEHNRGLGELLDALAARAQDSASLEESKELLQVAVSVVGRPNVGKSSLVNRLLGSERTIVNELPGTTRDAVDSLLCHDGIFYRIIDTAGIRRKGKTEARTEKISVLMALKNLQQADVALVLLDSVEGVTKMDATIAGYCYESGCSIIIVLNKWDLVAKSDQTLQEYTDSIRRRMKYLSFAPIITVSALTGQRVSKLFALIRQAYEARHLRIPTGTLNNLFVPNLEQALVAKNPAQTPAIRYIAQVGVSPPTFVVFLRGQRPLHFSAERFLVNQLRDMFGFYATPIRIQMRLKKPRGRVAR